jgi:hypothetical protein
MRSTTVGWLTSMVKVLPVIADHTWLKNDLPELRESTSHPMHPTNRTPRSNPRMSAQPTDTRDREDGEDGREDGCRGESSGISQG